MKIALDAMGGDHAPAVNVEGAVEILTEQDDLEVMLFGDEHLLKNELKDKDYPAGRIHIRHTSQVVGMHESPVVALRKKKDSSIRRAVDALKDHEADGFVSAGNSGVVMATAFYVLGKSKGVDRPAIAAIVPTINKPFVLIDAGANVDCNAENLLQFAMMGSFYASAVLGRHNPKVAMLSIGEEDTKGNELTKEAFSMLKNSDLNFIGNTEGKDVFMGNADVVVCDGFIGNIVLKTTEGLAEAMLKMLKREIAGVSTGKVGYLLMKPALRNFKKKTDYAEYGGAPLLGINGTCIISHGRSTARAIKNAIKVAAEFSRKKGHKVISEEIRSFNARRKTAAAS
ncbi:MAG: phosphate acyltransferase PlsX [Nitrospiraceae bacterium]|nr:phosphate acyltransferase PlsX [Nitrospiraceae bacterium]